jgi:hypothetical protein
MKLKKQKQINVLHELIGWAGVIFYIMAYLMLTLSVLDSTSPWLHLMYLLGALGIIFSSYKKHDLQPIIVNLFFAVIAIVALIGLIRLV